MYHMQFRRKVILYYIQKSDKILIFLKTILIFLKYQISKNYLFIYLFFPVCLFVKPALLIP